MKAVVDIGSNSVRLLIFESANDFLSGVTATEITRLGYQVSTTKRLSEAGVEATWAAFDRFQAIIKERQVIEVQAYATEAVRKAADGQAFVDEIHERYGWSVRIISGEEEAEIGFFGATSVLPGGDYTLIDIGGASTEIIQGSTEVSYQQSFAIGALRLTDDPDTDLSVVFSDLPKLQGELVGIGGTITTIMAMTLKLGKYERKLIQGQKLQMGDVKKWVEILPTMSLTERQSLPGLDPKREPIILAGMKILLYLMEAFQKDSLIVSDYGNLEGYAISRGLCNTNTSL